MKEIIEYLDKVGSIDDDAVMYATIGKERDPNAEYSFPFTLDQFREFTQKLWDDAGGWDASDKYVAEGAYFETYHVPFERDGKQYVMNIMYGQGSAWTLFTKAAHDEYKARVAKLDEKYKEEDNED